LAFSEVEQPKDPEWVEFEGGKYILGTNENQKNLMIVLPDKAMATDRLAIYGNVIEDPKTNSRHVNKKDKGKITPAGLGLYEHLINMKNDDGWFKFDTIIIRYSYISIIKSPRFEWSELVDDITRVLK